MSSEDSTIREGQSIDHALRACSSSPSATVVMNHQAALAFFDDRYQATDFEGQFAQEIANVAAKFQPLAHQPPGIHLFEAHLLS